MTQKEAVYKAITIVLDSEPDNPCVLSTEQKKEVAKLVVEMFEASEVSLSHPPKQGIVKYTPGLINNWVRKDKRLNGGETYVIKNKGSRAGAGDKKLKNLKRMLGVVKDVDKVKVQACIDKRQAEIKAEKAKDVEIDPDQIPEELQYLLEDQEE